MNKSLDEYVSADERRLEEILKGKNRMEIDEILGQEEHTVERVRKRCLFVCKSVCDS